MDIVNGSAKKNARFAVEYQHTIHQKPITLLWTSTSFSFFYFSFISYLLLFWFKPFSQITWINSLIWLLQNNNFDLRLRLALNDCKQIEPNASIGQPMRLCKWLINKLCMSSHTLESFQVRKYLTLDPELNIVFASEE